jgi:hypothetical protein
VEELRGHHRNRGTPGGSCFVAFAAAPLLLDAFAAALLLLLLLPPPPLLLLLLAPALAFATVASNSSPLKSSGVVESLKRKTTAPVLRVMSASGLSESVSCFMVQLPYRPPGLRITAKITHLIATVRGSLVFATIISRTSLAVVDSVT